MKVAATDATPFDSDKGFMFSGTGLRHIDDTYISYAKVLSCFHRALVQTEVFCDCG